eukprot:TRINITY_DN3025_c0_g1_i2.p1 TRINITY_DN3025_c0_g1~~TRINITY_DN3025_c0_g1_i2.p1  ORF type:complete len:411 (+),score=112.99 TRINITY_DN3025_c0_g1_i2:37-1233(+)
MPSVEHSLASTSLHGDLFAHNNPCNSHITPIYQTSTFYFDSVQHGADLFQGKGEGYIYSRLANPTVMNTESIIAKLEGTKHCYCFGSGMGALNASMITFLGAGDHFIVSDTMYGCTVNLTESYDRFNIERSTIDVSDLDLLRNSIKPNTKLIIFETPANPTLRVTDIEAIVAIAKEHNIITIVDNTFTTPIFQQPCKLGVDITVHSVTKYLNGHGDVVGGALCCNSDEMIEKIFHHRKDTGSLMAPMDAFLLARGLRTLEIRMLKHQENGLIVAKGLEAHPKVKSMYHPGLPSHPQHELAKKQMKGFSSMFAFELEGDINTSINFLNYIRNNSHNITLAVSLGTVDTLIQAPACMTHSGVQKEQREAAGITDGLIRVSIGLEDPQELLADLYAALENC